MTPFNNVQSWQHIISAAAYQINHLPRFILPDQNLEHFLFDGGSVYMDWLRDCFYKCMETTRDALLRIGSFGHILPVVDMSSLTDDLGNHTRGYGFVSEPRNNLVQQQNYILRLVMSTPSLRERFFVRVGRGRTILDYAHSSQYLQDLGKFACLLSSCILTCCGRPCRGTELPGLSLINTEHGVRNFVVKEGRIFVFQLRAKTQSVTGRQEARNMSLQDHNALTHD